jgi:hypothetical protein
VNEVNTKYLLGRYPKLYQGYNLPMTETCMCWGFDTGEGWFRLIDQLSADITALDEKNGSTTIAVQVKEKFGGLRFYIQSGSDAAYDLIDAAEEESLKTCETCGEPGTTRGGGWISTLCDSCWSKKQGEEKA